MPEVAEPEPAIPAGKVTSLLEINIVEQIEYYFGDFNMMKDKFLKQEVSKNDGWVSIATLLRFNRLAALSKDIDVILTAFKKNPSSIVEVNEDTKSVRRNPERPLPEHDTEWRNTVAERTIYIKGFPTETTTLDDILKFMQTFGKVDNVFKRCYNDKALKQWKFKGSVYVAFPTKEDAEKFMSIGSVKYAGNELIRKWQNDYVEEKKNERMKLKLEAKESKNKLLKEQQEERTKIKLPTGALIALSGLESKIGFHDLKLAAAKFGWAVSFIDYKMGESNAYVRLQTKDSAKDALEKLTNSSFEVKGVTVKAELVEGEKETKLLEKMEEDKNERVMQQLLKSRDRKAGKGGKKNKFQKQGRNDDSLKNGKKDESKQKKESDEEKKNVKLEPREEAAVKMEAESESAEPVANEASDENAQKRKHDEETQEEGSKKVKSEPKAEPKDEDN